MKSLLLIFCFFASNAFAQLSSRGPGGASPDGKRIYTNYPVPSRKKPANPMNVDTRFDVIENRDRYTFEIRHAFPGTSINSNVVPVYIANDFGHMRPVGTVNAGAKLKLDEFRVYAGKTYYVLPRDKSIPVTVSDRRFEPLPEEVFIPGEHVKVASYK